MTIVWIVLVSVLMMAFFLVATIAGNRAMDRQVRQIREQARKDVEARRPDE